MHGRAGIAAFAELIKSPEDIGRYEITAVSIWNGRAAGMPVSEMMVALRE